VIKPISEANNCRYDCKNIIGTFMCVCPEGYRKVGVTDECEDIDECAANPLICTGGGTCINIPGGFICECRPGLNFTNILRTPFLLDSVLCRFSLITDVTNFEIDYTVANHINLFFFVFQFSMLSLSVLLHIENNH